MLHRRFGFHACETAAGGELACCSVARFRACGAAAVWLSIIVEGLIFFQPLHGST